MFANAESYERFMGRWSRKLAARFIDFVDVPDELTLLDIGSGTGALSFEVARRKPKARMLGIDRSSEYLAYAGSLNPDPDRISFEMGDAQHLRFANATFGGVISLLAFNFIADPAQALSEACRVAKNGSPIAAAVWDYGGEMRMLRIFWDAAASMDERARKLDEGHMPLCRSGELSQLWKSAGLNDVQERPLNIEMRFSSFEDFWHPFLEGQGPAGAYAMDLDPADLQRLRSAVKDGLSLGAENTSFVLPARAWAVRGTVPGK